MAWGGRKRQEAAVLGELDTAGSGMHCAGTCRGCTTQDPKVWICVIAAGSVAASLCRTRPVQHTSVFVLRGCEVGAGARISYRHALPPLVGLRTDDGCYYCHLQAGMRRACHGTARCTCLFEEKREVEFLDHYSMTVLGYRDCTGQRPANQNDSFQ